MRGLFARCRKEEFYSDSPATLLRRIKTMRTGAIARVGEVLEIRALGVLFVEVLACSYDLSDSFLYALKLPLAYSSNL